MKTIQLEINTLIGNEFLNAGEVIVIDDQRARTLVQRGHASFAEGDLETAEVPESELEHAEIPDPKPKPKRRRKKTK